MPDAPGSGLVRIKAGHVYVAASSENPSPRHSGGIDAADSGNTVNVQAESTSVPAPPRTRPATL